LPAHVVRAQDPTAVPPRIGRVGIVDLGDPVEVIDTYVVWCPTRGFRGRAAQIAYEVAAVALAHEADVARRESHAQDLLRRSDHGVGEQWALDVIEGDDGRIAAKETDRWDPDVV